MVQQNIQSKADNTNLCQHKNERYKLKMSKESALNQCTVQTFTESDDTRCCVNTIFLPEDGHVNARNMSALNQCTVQTFTESDDTRFWVNTIFPPEDGHVNARNMSKIIV